ncbi:hemolysin family protein [Robertmurraya sp. DFI.2.37]|uniref:hemolysin family protein n=1 Tax=Robertmurraya sp. DFI.2.37 TaxID=3031819 RepID=UPI0028164BA7|nr:hemolysin family protein [Robertmurraya sp. DFI.2.37]
MTFLGVEIFILAILIILNAFFAGSEMALVSLSDSRLKQLAEDGDKKAKSVQWLLSEPSRFLATIQIGITLSTLMASAFATRNFVGMMSISLNKYFAPAIDRQLLEVVATIIITLVLSYFTLVLGELVPKRLAVHKAEQIAFLATAPLAILSKVISPFVQLLTFSTNLIVRVFGVDPNVEEEEVTEEEIRMMVDVGQERGTIQAAEKEMINNIFEFDNKTVSDIMTHRTNIVAIPLDLSFQEAVHVANVEKYTRIPVYEENIDHIVGILHVKDLFTFIENGSQKQFNLQELIREPFYALESLRIDHLFRDMQKNKVHMAIAIDEYGGTDGIVTMEDILEEIVGNIFDEYDDPELDREEIEKIAEQEYMMIGTVDLDDVEDMLKVDFPTEEFDTLSGFIIGQLGYIPDREERPTIEYENHLFVVEEINERRIVKVKVIVLEGEEQE